MRDIKMNDQPMIKNSASPIDRRLLVIAGVIMGVALLAIAAIYIIQPASSLPHFFPGYIPGDPLHHFKHALAAFILALGAFAVAWFSSGPVSTDKK
jgi:amino acid permease